MKKKHIHQLINKVRAGQATPVERLEFERFCEWANNNEELFNALTNEEKETIRQEIFRSVSQRIDAIERNEMRRRFLPTPWMRIAASLSVIATVAFLYYWINRNQDNHVIMSSAYGAHTRIVLPDSSEVILNGNSSIRYANSWSGQDDREVWLYGEGFFDVRHTKNHQRFIVHTEEDMDVQVLGTRFNVKVRRGKAQIMLEEGRVRLNGEDSPSDTVTLIPGELATFHGGALVKERIDPARYASWKDHKLYFDETPLSEVALILEDTYGYKVVFADKALSSRKLSGQIQSKDVSDIISAIEESLGIDIRVKDTRLEIDGSVE